MVKVNEIADSLYTVSGITETEYKIQKSVFIAGVYPAENKEQSIEYHHSVKKKYFDASHHPFAFRIGFDKNNFRYNDDGEPTGSSGKPILDAIDKFNITNVMIVVTRYYGGVKLGVGGLKRAYYDSAVQCIEKTEIVEKILFEDFRIIFDYDFISPVMNYLEKHKFKVIENVSDEKVRLICPVRLSCTESFRKELINLTKGKILIENKVQI